MMWYPVLLLAVGLERIAEMVLAQRNLSWSRARGGIELGAGHYPVMVVLHLALLVGCALEVLVLHRPFIPALGWSMLALVAAAQGLRWWCIATLGRQWNTRVVVIPGAARITGGPYRWLSHPNYVAVILEGWPFRSSTRVADGVGVHHAQRCSVEHPCRRGEFSIGGWHERPHRRRRRTCGLATAIHAARAGLEVTVVERRPGPVDKACGEGLMPHTLRHLDSSALPRTANLFAASPISTGLDVSRRAFRRSRSRGSAHSAVRRPFTTPQQAQGSESSG